MDLETMAATLDRNKQLIDQVLQVVGDVITLATSEAQSLFDSCLLRVEKGLTENGHSAGMVSDEEAEPQEFCSAAGSMGNPLVCYAVSRQKTHRRPSRNSFNKRD